MENLLKDIPDLLQSEQFDTILDHSHCRIERILSQGHTSPAQGWYDQDEPEWVLVLQGSGKIEFEQGQEVITLNPGDHLFIPAHHKHRVIWTEPEAVTIWLAVFFCCN